MGRLPAISTPLPGTFFQAFSSLPLVLSKSKVSNSEAFEIQLQDPLSNRYLILWPTFTPSAPICDFLLSTPGSQVSTKTPLRLQCLGLRVP
ncbi:uncharacterized protein EI90DRAFT_3124505 [Cantharellus anzutake]|uniref:uncharacterized protein n=1 Tax=Cantharellus anzutake TaxID=1750568 RepID=UPI0019075574|nr:uncharacterized protein EI90DRAFT_3124505 [Cantharellus anzutake]KAF8330414.1 hypothetical protein EI90DRAFT_3124505 [Cantharellus anzutake]